MKKDSHSTRTVYQGIRLEQTIGYTPSNQTAFSSQPTTAIKIIFDFALVKDANCRKDEPQISKICEEFSIDALQVTFKGFCFTENMTKVSATAEFSQESKLKLDAMPREARAAAIHRLLAGMDARMQQTYPQKAQVAA